MFDRRPPTGAFGFGFDGQRNRCADRAIANKRAYVRSRLTNKALIKSFRFPEQFRFGLQGSSNQFTRKSTTRMVHDA